jgi:cell division protein FtsA
MVGRRLEIDAFVLASQEGPLKTLGKAINEAGVEVEEFLFAPVAAAAATLTDDERRLGSVLIDIGHGTTSYAAFAGDRILVAGCFPIGSAKINDDLVHRFQTTAAGAEVVKRTAGSVLLSDIGEEETLSVPTIDGRGSHVVLRREVCKTIRIRMQETLELVASEVWRQIPQDAPCTGVVLCGGGSHLDGLVALAEEVFVKRARLGEMEGVVDTTHLLASSELPSRAGAVAVGLLVHARDAQGPAGTTGMPTRRSGGFASKIKKFWMGKKGGRA